MESFDRIDQRASGVFDAARAFHEAAGRSGSSTAALGALARLEEALGALSAGWYEVSADEAWPTLPNEQDALLRATLHETAAAFARCARSCRGARHKLKPLIEPEDVADRPSSTAVELATGGGPEPIWRPG
jgi:hypothetical protein